MNTITITNSLEMAGFIKSNGTQCRFVSIVTKTPVVDIRVGNPWGASKTTKNGLYKVSRKMGIVNANFNNSVRKRLAEQLGITLSEVEYTNGNVWYEHLTTKEGKNLPLVQHKDEAKREGKLYLQYFPHKTKNAYVDEAGNPVNEETVKPFLYAKKDKPDWKPTVIAVSLDNVKELRASGVIMEAADLEAAEKVLE